MTIQRNSFSDWYPYIQTGKTFSSHFVKILSPLRTKFQLKTVIASLDVDSLFANIPLNETIDICIKKLFQKPKVLVNELSINIFVI